MKNFEWIISFLGLMIRFAIKLKMFKMDDAGEY